MNTTEHIWFSDHITAHLAGELNDDEQSQFQSHLKNCTSCAEEFSQIKRMDDTMRNLFIAPGNDFEQRVISRLRLSDPPRHRLKPIKKIVIAATAAIALGGLGYAGMKYFEYGRFPTAVDADYPLPEKTTLSQPQRTATTEPAENQKIEAKLQHKLPEVHFDKVALEDVISFLRDVSSCDIKVDWRALQAAGITKDKPITVQTRDATFAQVLQKILDQADNGGAKAIFTVKDGAIVITVATTAP
jgi:hypothetical protein